MVRQQEREAPPQQQKPLTRGLAAVRQAFGYVRAMLDSLNLQPNDLVLVACSGGADSLALAVAAVKAAHRVGETTRKNGFSVRVGAVIVDHQLQAGSAQVAAKAAEQCRRLGLDPVVVETVEVAGVGGPEAAAREARYEALERVALDLGAKAVLLGHTLDDQAESVLLGLARGSGARSLAGIPERRGLFARPFLQVRRNTTELICHQHGLEPWLDPTNGQPVHLRNRIRLIALPALHDAVGPGVSEALARTAEQLAEDAEALDHYAAQLLIQAAFSSNDGAGGPGFETGLRPSSADGSSSWAVEQVRSTGRRNPQGLDVRVLLAAPVAVRRRALRLAASQAGAPASDLSRAQVLAMDALVANWHGQSPHKLPGGVIVGRTSGKLWFDCAQVPSKGVCEWN